MRHWINLVETTEAGYLYHGTSASNLDTIFEDGLTGPSYWGTSELARDYMRQYSDGVLFCLPIDRFIKDGLAVNEGLVDSLRDDGDDAPMPETWEESLEEYGSVIYEYTLRVYPSDIQSRLDEAADLPMDPASRMARATEMGYTTPAFHGTGKKFNEFDMDKGKPTTMEVLLRSSQIRKPKPRATQTAKRKKLGMVGSYLYYCVSRSHSLSHLHGASCLMIMNKHCQKSIC